MDSGWIWRGFAVDSRSIRGGFGLDSGRIRVGFGVEFNSAIESMTLQAFDCYSAQREKIYQLKVDESKNKAFMLLKKAGI